MPDDQNLPSDLVNQNVPDEATLEREMPGGRNSRDPYAAFRYRDYALYAIGGILNATGTQMRGVAVGWELYERTRSPLALGYVGLVQAIPVMLLALPSGSVADRFNRRWVLALAQLLAALVGLSLAWVSWSGAPVTWLYVLLGLGGVASAFGSPAAQSLWPQLVPHSVYPNAVTWNSMRWQIASTVGPAAGGLIISLYHSAVPVYILDGLSSLSFMLFLLVIRPRPQEKAVRSGNSLDDLLAGLRFVRSHRLIFPTVTLDMLAVFFGGATALLPIYARDILQVGPQGLGWLRAAPAVGAIMMGLTVAHLPPMRRAGKVLLWAVAGFGIAMIVFGLSRNFYLSLFMLFLTGALDNISVVVRHTLIQLLTPDNMRGRVSAVNSVFIGASNELGEFESGVLARFLGPVIAVVAGGIGTLGVVGAIGWRFPAVRRLDRMTDKRNAETL